MLDPSSSMIDKVVRQKKNSDLSLVSYNNSGTSKVSLGKISQADDQKTWEEKRIKMSNFY